MLDIRLLGSPQVTLDGEDVEVDTRKAIALLAYLAIEKSADRDSLAALFWADSPPERARATLRRTLSALRGGVGHDVIGADRNQVELVGSFWLDVDHFLTAIAETAKHNHDGADVCGECVAPLRRAADLYRNDFLGAFSVRDAPEFEDWARPVTESLRLRAGEVFERLAMALASTGDYSGAIEAAGRWIELDELHEPAHRRLMLLNAWAGDRPGAIQAYRDCVAILDSELGVAPLEETTELYEAILDEDLPPAPAVRRAVRPVRTAPKKAAPVLIDRREEIALLRGSLEQARSQGLLCVVSGDSWMGKTRIIEHLAEQAESSGFLALPASAFRAETRLPYGVAIQLLRGLLDASAGGAELPAWALQELARLDPKLTPGQVTEGAERLGALRLREAFLTLVETVAAAKPMLITVDDAQWMDTASASLVAHLQRRLSQNPILIVITARDEKSLPASLREIGADADVSIRLEPLTASTLRDDYPEADLDGIVSATGGIPLLVKEAIDAGSVVPDSSSVNRYMESRRRRLSDLSRQVMAAAAVLNGMCEAQLLRDTSGRTDDEVVEAVEELIDAGLLREEVDGHLGFTLDVLESVTYESTSLIRRRLLHRRAAEALQSRARARTDARLAAATAVHLRAAGSDGASDWYRLAGDLARSVFAYDEAVAAYENAIALGHNDVGELHLGLGELAMARGDYQSAMRELRAAASHSADESLAVVEHRIGDLNRILGRFELAEENFERARSEHPDPPDLFADWALLKHRTGDDESAIALAKEALEAAEDTGDDERIARALNILGVVTPDSEPAMEHIDEALEILGPTDPGRMAALNNKARLLAGRGDVDVAIGLVEEAIGFADRAGYRHHQAALLNHLADLNHQAGREEMARRSLTEAVTLFADIDTGDWEPEVWLLREW
jgi:DNA-binding SARP family transcriptional activator/Flp pilus assembly protein TadD